MKNVDKIIAFFNRVTNCPICGATMTRRMHLHFAPTPNEGFIEYESLASSEHYAEFEFTKDQERDRLVAPSTINLIDKMPPSIHFLSVYEAYILCSKCRNYQLSANSNIEPYSERFIMRDYDIMVYRISIHEAASQITIPTPRNYILTCTPDEIRDKVRKLILIQ